MSGVRAALDTNVAIRLLNADADLRLTLKCAGRPIPENDLWIAAFCLRHRLVLVTSDAHFSACPGLVTEDWNDSAP